MKLTSFTDYSLRLMMYLAAAPDRRVTISEVAQTFAISENHLTKVAHFLGKQGWVATTRGKGGGLSLAKAPKDICIGSVVRDTEGADEPVECFTKKDACVLTPVCKLKKGLYLAVQAFYQVLDNYTLADITENRNELAKALRIIPIHAA